MFLNPVTEIIGVMIAELQNTLRKEPVSSRTKEHKVIWCHPKFTIFTQHVF